MSLSLLWVVVVLIAATSLSIMLVRDWRGAAAGHGLG
jgi:hypothetical protein